jgi:hypothetical protein
MKRVLFFFEEKWAFGTIHKALCKELYQHGIYANILDWSTKLSTVEFDLLNRVYDIFVTLPNVAPHLLRAGIPFDKIVVVAHEQRDLYEAQKQQGLDFLNEIRQFAVTSSVLKIKSKELKEKWKNPTDKMLDNYERFVNMAKNQKRGKDKSKRKQRTTQKVFCCGIIYEDAVEASKVVGINPVNIRRRCRLEQYTDWYYLE